MKVTLIMNSLLCDQYSTKNSHCLNKIQLNIYFSLKGIFKWKINNFIQKKNTNEKHFTCNFSVSYNYISLTLIMSKSNINDLGDKAVFQTVECWIRT